MNYVFSFIVAALLTSLSYFLGDFWLTKGIALWHAAVIGTTVVTIGAVVEKLHSPMWLIILIPFPVGMGLLYLFLNETFTKWFLTYALTLFIYVIIHIIVSSLFRFHSLIPAWKLSK